MIKALEGNDLFFNGLNYTLANEDPSLEYLLLPERVGQVLSIAGSGSRVIPLLARSPAKLVCADLSPEQLYMTELRIESVRHLTHSEFLRFWGYADCSNRKLLFEKISSLRPEASEYFKALFEYLEWGSLLYLGKWEKRAKKVSRLIRRIAGPGCDRLFDCKTLPEQKEFLAKEFPRWRWKVAIYSYTRILALMRRLKPGSFPSFDSAFRFYPRYSQAFDQMFADTLARKSFILQIIFFGELRFPEGYPLECDANLFQAAKNALKKTQVRYVCGHVIDRIQQSSDAFDFISFSNVPSYFPKSLSQDYLQQIQDRLSPKARVVVRTFLSPGRPMDQTGYRDISSQHWGEIDQEMTRSYQVQVFEKNA